MTGQTEKRKRGRPRSTIAKTDPSPVQALDRGILILLELAKQPGATLSDLARQVSMPPSTAHRFLATLQNHGFVDFSPHTQQWSVGIGAFRVGNAYLNRTNLVEAAHAPMRHLMEETGETANLGIADNGFIVFISQIETQNPVRAMFRAGTRSQMHASGIGKAMLAQMPEEAALKLVNASGLPQFTAQTLTSVERILDDLALTRERGWAFDNEERFSGMRCIASAVFDRQGAPIAGVSVSGPSARFTDKRLNSIGGIVRTTAELITESTTGGASSDL